MQQQYGPERCEVCDAYATIEVRVKSTGARHLYCGVHQSMELMLRGGDLEQVRSRLKPDSGFSSRLAAPEDSEEHQGLYLDLVEYKFVDGEYTLKYFLSVMTGIDQFALWTTDFYDNVRTFLTENSASGVAYSPVNSCSLDAMWPFFEQAYHSRKSGAEFKQKKQLRAVTMLIHYPMWSDEEIANAVPTTLNQLSRNSLYKALRAYAWREAAEKERR